MATTPTTPGMGYEEALYRGAAMSCLRRLKDANKGLTIFHGTYQLPNGVEVFCNVCGNKEDVYVRVPATSSSTPVTTPMISISGVMLHPRQGFVHIISHKDGEEWKTELYGVSGGWRDGKEPLVTNYIYPLVDSDNASFGLTKSGDSMAGRFMLKEGNYGNLYWHNDKTDSKSVLLSWKGTPSRHFRLGSDTYINGFVDQETTSPGIVEDTYYYTSFTPNIYKGGVLFMAAPKYNWPRSGQDRCLVLGAMQDNEGIVWIVTQSDRYEVPKYIFIFSDGYRIDADEESEKTDYLYNNTGVTLVFEKNYPTDKGIYTMLWKGGGVVNGWSFIAEYNTGRQGLPWFGNASGTEFVCPNGNKISVSGTMTAKEATYGVYSEPDAVCSGGSFTATYEGNDFFEYKGDSLISAEISFAFATATAKSATSVGVKVFRGDFDVLYDPEQYTPQPLVAVGGTETIVIGQGVFINTTGGEGEIKITYSGFTVVDGIVTEAPCAMDGDDTAAGTITATDACGGTAIWKARLPNGIWIETGFTYFGCTGYSCCDEFGHFFPADWPFCGNHYSMDTTCKFFWSQSNGYATSEQISQTRKSYAAWGWFYTNLGYPYETPLAGSYAGDRGGSPPPPPTDVLENGEGYTLLPMYKSASKWVCP